MRDIPTYSPTTLREAVEILARERGGARVLAGGTDLIVQILERKRAPRALVNLSGIPGLSGISEEGGMVRIGAMTTHREIERSALLKARAGLLCEAAFLVGSPQIRNLATIGGNVANGSPVADTVPPLMALGAVLTLRGPGGERALPMRAFCLAPGKTAMRAEEILTEIRFKGLPPDGAGFYERLGQRRLLSISKVGVAFLCRNDGGVMRGVTISLGAVAPTVIMAPRAAAFLEGKAYSEDIAAEAGRIAEGESRAISDIRSTREYRNRMAGALLVRGLARLFHRTG